MASKNSWFKHYNTSFDGRTMTALWASKDSELIAFYWALLEMVSRWESEESRGEVVLELATLRSKLSMNAQRSRKLLSKIVQTFEIKVEWISEESFKVSLPNWLELQERRGGKRESLDEQKTGKKGVEVRGKKKEVRSKNLDTEVTHALSQAQVAAAWVWDFYSKAYAQVHGAAPTRNAKINSQIKSFVGRIPHEDAPHVAEFYVRHPKRYYVEKRHPIGVMLADAETLHVEWQTGRTMTTQTARNVEQASEYRSQLERMTGGGE